MLIVLGLLVVCGGCVCSWLATGTQELGQIGYPHPKRPDASNPLQDDIVAENLTPEEYQRLWAIVMGCSVGLAILVATISIMAMILRDRSLGRRMVPPGAVRAGSGLAMGALVAGILSTVICVLPYVSLPLAAFGLVLGIAATRWAGQGRSGGLGLAIAAISTSAYGIVQTGILLAYYTYVIFGTPV
ncbi:hypothetical protein ACFO1B_07890 [Dactylosporangium siamense]|uniref:hypothetical protein n=1 Tax=Dactylosporangium siamense TaxID=685454 RepID=UPI0019406ECC|nr:hypothetical protein [Dactylosporangium siamense]